MAEKNLNNIRIVNKHDTEENWLKATGFTPKQGELIVYDIDENYDYERIKIGDGVQNVNVLPFIDDALIASINDKQSANFKVTLSMGSSGITADKTFSEIQNAHNEGRNVVADLFGSSIPLYGIADHYVAFVITDLSSMTYGRIECDPNNQWTFVQNVMTAQSNQLGAVKADAKLETDTIPARIGSDGKLYVDGTLISNLNSLVGDTAVSEQISKAISNQDVATSSEKGLMSSEDKKFVDNLQYINLGSMEGKTVSDLRLALKGWLDAVYNIPNASARFRSSEFMSLWNAEDTTTTLSSGANWTVTLKTYYTNGTYAQLEICNYYYKAVYYVAITNGSWTEIRKVFFDSDNVVYVGPTQPTDPNIKVWINTSEEGSGVIPVLPRVATITLTATGWTGGSAPYSQVVEINTVTTATKVELNPTVAQIVNLQNDDIALMAENDGGVVTVYSFGGKPSADMTMQVTLTEVSYV